MKEIGEFKVSGDGTLNINRFFVVSLRCVLVPSRNLQVIQSSSLGGTMSERRMH